MYETNVVNSNLKIISKHNYGVKLYRCVLYIIILIGMFIPTAVDAVGYGLDIYKRE